VLYAVRANWLVLFIAVCCHAQSDLAALRERANRGEASAQTSLGGMYANGQGVSKDYVEAVRWYRMAADQARFGDCLAQIKLGEMYERGEGVPKDLITAYMWSNFAAANGSDVGKWDREKIEKQMTPQQISEAQRLTREWKPNIGNQQSLGGYRIGGGVSAPSVLSKVEAEYTEEARRANIQGTVVLSLVVDDQGRPQNLKVLRSLRTDLDQKAIQAVEKWRFNPGIKDGKPVPVMATIEVNFHLCINERSGFCYDTINQVSSVPVRPVGNSFEVGLHKQNGVLLVPVLINSKIPLDFVLDSGAADVSVPADVVLTLMRTGTLTSEDFTGTNTYVLADGSRVPSETFRIRSLKVGDRVLENVSGSLAPANGSLLLGQSFLSRFRSWSIDNTRQVLVLGSIP